MSDSLDIVSRLLEEARRHGATGADAVMFETLEVSASRRMGKREGLERAESKAVALRAFVGDRQAMVSSSDTGRESLAALAERAAAMAKAAPADADSKLAPASLYADKEPDLELSGESEPDDAWLDEQCRQAEEAALATPGVTNSEGADAGYSKSRISLAIAQGNNIGFARCYENSHSSLSVSVLAGEGAGMERDYDFTTARWRDDLDAPAQLGENAARRAIQRLNPRKVATCRAAVMFDARTSRQLISIFASAISGSAVTRGASFLKDRFGEKIFPADIAIIDDPHRKRGLGSRPFDAEGVRNTKRALIEKGLLKSWLLDMRTASKLGLETTGHATRGLSSPPSPSSTNLYMENGALSPAALMKEMGSGLLVTETFGMGVNIITGDYSQGASGFWIENGEIAYPVSEITIAGHLRDMFAHLTPANDLSFRYATNAPSIRIESMTIAGT